MAFTIDELINTDNLVPELDEDVISEISSAVLEGFEIDKNSRAGWEENIDKWTKLASQVMEEKSYPWPNASNVKYPLLTVSAMQFAARAYPAIVPNQTPVQARVMGKDPEGMKMDKARRVAKHMNYQIMEEMEEWEKDMDKLCVVLPILGTAFKKTYYNDEKRRNVSELVLPKDLVVNYYAKNLETASRKTHVLYYYRNDLEEMFRSGFFIEPEGEIPDSSLTNKAGSQEDTQYLTPPSTDPDAPYSVLECHAFWDLDEDGYKEPYVITVLEETGDVLRIAPRFGYDSVVQMENGEVQKIVPDEFFTDYIFIPDPNSGIYGLGFGHLLGPLNESVNTLINQLIDAGHLSNLQSGFISKNLQVRGGIQRFKPGEWKQTNSYSDDLRKSIVPLPVREPSNVLFSLLGMLEQAGMRVATVTEMIQGESPGQNTKATVAMALLDQGLKVFSSIYKRVRRSLHKELKKLFILNSIYMDEDQYFRVLDGTAEEMRVSRTDYDDETDITPHADPSISTEEQRLLRIQSAGELLQLGTIDPMEYTRRFLEATEQPNPDNLILKPQPPQPSFEEQIKMEELRHKQAMDVWNAQLEAMKFDLQAIKDQAAALKDIAEAEAKEAGTDLEYYKTQMENLQQEENQLRESIKALQQQGPQQGQQAPQGGAGQAQPAQATQETQ